MSEQRYQTKLAQSLWELYQEWNERLAQTGGMWGMAYKLLRAEVPYMLTTIDEDEELRVKIRDFVKRLSVIIQEDETEGE